MVQAFTCVAVEAGGDVSVGMVVGTFWAGSGDANSTANVVGLGDSAGDEDGVDVSANDNEMPPITSMSETAPMMNPLPIWRRAFMTSPPTLTLVCRGEAAH